MSVDLKEAQSVGAEASTEAIRVQDLRKSFGTLDVLKGVSLTAHQGDVVAIIGGSGSGKSTFLRCINFLETGSGLADCSKFPSTASLTSTWSVLRRFCL